MSKKKSTISPSDFLMGQIGDNQASNPIGSLFGTQAERAVIGLPLRALSLQWLYSSDVYPLGRMELHIGESDTSKSALLFEKMRWFLREPTGLGYYLLNESRDPADLRSSIIGKSLLSDNRFKLDGPHDSLEHWQRNLTRFLKYFETTFSQRGACHFPVIIGLDSVTGSTNEKAIDDINETGHAKITFGMDANLLNTYSKFIFQKIHPWPIAFIATSHIKYSSDRYGNKVMKIPGGDALRYNSTYITLMTKGKDLSRVSIAGGRNLKLTMMKSMGDHRSIEVEFFWIFEPDPITGEATQVSFWDWHSATVELLTSFTGERGKAVSEIIDLSGGSVTSRTIGCKQLGFTKPAPYAEVGKAIMEDAETLRNLQAHFGIKNRLRFAENVPYSDQISAAIAANSSEIFNPGTSEDIAQPTTSGGSE